MGTRGGTSPTGREGDGYAYVIYGTDGGFPAVLDLPSIDGTNGFVIDPGETSDLLGESVSLVGDVNGDGLADAVIGDLAVDFGDTSVRFPNYGSAHVIFGSDGPMTARITPDDLDGSNGFNLIGSIIRGGAGTTVSNAGDFNGDGLNDIIVSADNIGVVYVVFGSRDGFDRSLDLEELDGTNGVKLFNGGDLAGRFADYAGDVNGDGFDDILVGSPFQNDFRIFDLGEVYVVFGTDATTSPEIDLQTLDGTNGYTIAGDVENFNLGLALSPAGDVNQDGYDDVLVGASAPLAPGSDSTFPPKPILIYGGPDGFQYDRRTGTEDGEVITGTAAQELIQALGGNDWIVSGGGSDGIDGGEGIDMVSFADSARILFASQSEDGFRVGNGLGSQITLENVEQITGTSDSDTFYAYEGRFRGLGGQDTFIVRRDGVARYEGGGSRDTIDYSASDAGITASLFRGRGWEGDAAGDRYDSIETFIATNHDDIIWGDNGNNRIEGLHGDDTLYGAGGDDYILAGVGTDVVVFSGTRAEYRIATQGIRTEVEHLNGGYDGFDVIGHAEVLRFVDGDLLVSDLMDMG